MILYILIGFFSGIISGMGIGGGTILIPALTFFSGMAQTKAQCINLLFFIPTASVSLIFHIKNKSIEKKGLLSLILVGVVFALIGSFAMTFLQGDVLRKLFGGLLFIIGVSEIFKKSNTQKGLPH
jgi:uncharacterized membrane protein YfcA